MTSHWVRPTIATKLIGALALAIVGSAGAAGMSVVLPSSLSIASPVSANYSLWCKNMSFGFNTTMHYIHKRFWTTGSASGRGWNRTEDVDLPLAWYNPADPETFIWKPTSNNGTSDSHSAYPSGDGWTDAPAGPYTQHYAITRTNALFQPFGTEEESLPAVSVPACADIVATNFNLDKTVYHVGETVKSSMTFKNNSSIGITTDPGLTYSIKLFNAATWAPDGSNPNNRTIDNIFTETGGFAPNQSRSYNYNWIPNLTPGQYDVQSRSTEVKYRFNDYRNIAWRAEDDMSVGGNYPALANNQSSFKRIAIIESPKNLAASSSCSSVILSWQKGGGITNLQLRVYNSANNEVKNVLLAGNATGATITGLPFNNTYRYVLNAKVTVNGTTYTDSAINGPSTTLSNCLNLTANDFELTDSSGATQRIFDRGERFYFKGKVSNVLAGTGPSGSKTVFCKLTSYCPNYYDARVGHGTWPGNSTYAYGTYPGGSYESAFEGTKSGAYYSSGIYTARMQVNPDSDSPVEETSYTDNTADYSFAVINQPTNPTQTYGCNWATFSWLGGDSTIHRYRVHITNMDSGGQDDYYTSNGQQLSLTKNGLSQGPHSYQWQLYAQVIINGTTYEYTDGNKNSFTTTACLTFTVQTPTQTLAAPGIPADTLLKVDYSPSASQWNSQNGTYILGVLGVIHGTTCSPFSDPTDFDVAGPSGWPDNSAKMNGGSLSMSYKAGDSVSVLLTPPDTAEAGQLYTVCIGASSSEATTATTIIPVEYKIVISPWLQVKSPSTELVGQTGSVHSNGTVNMTIPNNKYFFFNGYGGVLSAAGSISIPLARQASTTPPKWRSEHNSFISSPTYDSLWRAAQGRQKVIETVAEPNANYYDNKGISYHMDKHCGTTSVYLVDGDLTPANYIRWWHNGCSSAGPRQLVYFINGNMTVNDYIADETDTSTLTFVIKGDLTISESVDRLDGVYLVGGTIDDGGGSTPLVVHGSLLGLGGSTPTASAGVVGASLRRSVGENLDPAITIVYQPKYLDLLKGSAMAGSERIWKEIE